MFDKILKMPLLWANNHAKLKTKALQQGWKKESDYFLLVGFEHVFSYWIFQNLLEPFSNTPSGIILIYFSRIFFEFCRYLFFSWHFENLKRNVTVLYEKKITLLTLSWRRPLSYRNQSIDLLCKSVDWFLYDNGLPHKRVKISHIHAQWQVCI